jgi:hypothetical protein
VDPRGVLHCKTTARQGSSRQGHSSRKCWPFFESRAESFTDAEGAGAHCQAGAQRLPCARMLDWLDETLAGSGARPASSRP